MPSVPARLIILSLWAGLLRGGPAPTFYKDVLPILQTHCQGCHRSGEIAPMAFDTYAHTRPFAAAIREQTTLHKMPPWFADACCGHFSNDRSLSAQEIATLTAWADAKAPGGDPGDAPTPLNYEQGWNIAKPDVVLKMPKPQVIPASGDVAYQYVIIPTHFTEDKWVRMSEIRPSNRAVVHHAVAYVRPPDSKWLRGDPRDEKFIIADILLVYAPGSLPDQWPEGYAKLVPAGADIVLQMHYTTNGHAAEDQTSIGLVFSAVKPEKRVITVQLTNDTFTIPAGEDDYRVEVHGSIPNDALLLSFFPHMHLRGKTFEYNIVEPHGRIRTLLRISHYNFYWQLSYRLATPIPLKAGTILQAVATFDNSKNNPHNPDPTATVEWGEQTWAEMMVGFFDVAVDPSIDKLQFFVRH
jgi:copper type II ascorbate-dependent monooxygenase-like protein